MKKKLAIGLTLLAIATLSSLAFLVPTLAAHPTSIFALEHRVGKPGASPDRGGLTFSCGPNAVKGNLVVSVNEKVVNDADSGQAGNYWALDAFSRTIHVWNTGPDSYCATIIYTGTFGAQAGQQSPGSTATTGGILTGDEIGTLKGGYVAMISGPLFVSDPANWPLVGKVNLGNPVDYACVINPDGTLQDNQCSGAVDWTSKYFDTSASSFTFNQPTWGWSYVGRDAATAPDAGTADGVWHNFSTGNSGDILDVD